MADTYLIPENPEYNPAIRKLQNGDPANAETIFNPLILAILSNIEAVKIIAETGDIDCGYFVDAEQNPVQEHNTAMAAHMNLNIDGNSNEQGALAATLEEHMQDPNAHGNIKIDGNI